MRSYDVVVVGLGVMGAAAALQLARRGLRVFGVDRFAPPHPFGSSHGRTRIIREAYFEGEFYIPLVRRALAAWGGLAEETGRMLHQRTGGLTIAPARGGLAEQARRNAARHRVQLELLDTVEVGRRFPMFAVAEHEVAVWEPGAGVLLAETCVEALLDTARAAGAELRFGDVADRWDSDGAGVRVRTRAGDVRAAHLVLAAGAWMPLLVPEIPLQVERNTLFWFETAAADEPLLTPARLPVFIHEFEPGRVWYGVPEPGAVKVAVHHGGELAASAEAVRRQVDAAECDVARKLLGRLLPAAAGPLRGAVVCLYSNTPDRHFVIDAHPRYPQVILVSACSGHGFKFAPVVGEEVVRLLAGEAATPEFRWRWGA